MATLPNPFPATPPPRPKNWFVRHWVFSIFAGLFCSALLFGGFIGSIFYVVEISFKKSTPYKEAITKAETNPVVIEKFGQPIKPGWVGSGNINVAGPSGNADISIPISGPKRDGTIYVVAEKTAGKWHFKTLEVEVEGESQRINLLPTESPEPQTQLLLENTLQSTWL